MWRWANSSIWSTHAYLREGLIYIYICITSTVAILTEIESRFYVKRKKNAFSVRNYGFFCCYCLCCWRTSCGVFSCCCWYFDRVELKMHFDRLPAIMSDSSYVRLFVCFFFFLEMIRVVASQRYFVSCNGVYVFRL